ncbi:MAG: hypothetical protein HY039_01865 [Nitrospirae bacterium]|nr:hypothetical protein [Nitrospirota bacterium]
MVQKDGGSRGAGEGGWLVLIYRTPAVPSALRVRVWRRLRTLGAVSLHDGVAMLPASEESEEDFGWLAVEIRERGGEAHVLRAAALNAAEERRIRRTIEPGQRARGRGR